jgi:general secretion pathway protein H
LRNLGRAQGFTLIEILVVVFIIGLTAGLISLSVGNDKKDSLPYQETQLLLQKIAFVSEYAALNGEVIAMFAREEAADGELEKRWCYNWQRLRDNSWGGLPDDILPEHCLPFGLSWEMEVEGRLYMYDPDLEIHPPVLLFSPSGESTAVAMTLFESAGSSDAQHIEIDMMGNSRWLEEDEANSRYEQ